MAKLVRGISEYKSGKSGKSGENFRVKWPILKARDGLRLIFLLLYCFFGIQEVFVCFKWQAYLNYKGTQKKEI